MFAAIYFGQVAFAALPFAAVTPPIPPIPPPPTYAYACRFAIGQVVGVADDSAAIALVGLRGDHDSLINTSATRSRSSRLPILGTASGPGSGTCP